MQPLDKSLRNRLERTIKQAREIAEAAARAALGQLGVAEATPFEHLSEDDKALRRKLRVHGRQLGDALLPSPSGRGAGVRASGPTTPWPRCSKAPITRARRWKPLEKQPIGWNPDLNDGVRLNICPFLTVPNVSKKDAGVLRDKPNINWNKDRGKDVESAPWYRVFGGDRINDHHLTLEEKRAAREKNGGQNCAGHLKSAKIAIPLFR